jgi:hypothetical protein
MLMSLPLWTSTRSSCSTAECAIFSIEQEPRFCHSRGESGPVTVYARDIVPDIADQAARGPYDFFCPLLARGGQSPKRRFLLSAKPESVGRT